MYINRYLHINIKKSLYIDTWIYIYIYIRICIAIVCRCVDLYIHLDDALMKQNIHGKETIIKVSLRVL